MLLFTKLKIQINKPPQNGTSTNVQQNLHVWREKEREGALGS